MSDGNRRKDNAKSKEENPFFKHSVALESVATSGREIGHEPQGLARHRVRIVSRRVRLCDPDNLIGGTKHLIDALRISRLIPEDDPKAITLEVSQEKVSSYADEETWVEITR